MALRPQCWKPRRHRYPRHWSLETQSIPIMVVWASVAVWYSLRLACQSQPAASHSLNHVSPHPDHGPASSGRRLLRVLEPEPPTPRSRPLSSTVQTSCRSSIRSLRSDPSRRTRSRVSPLHPTESRPLLRRGDQSSGERLADGHDQRTEDTAVVPRRI